MTAPLPDLLRAGRPDRALGFDAASLMSIYTVLLIAIPSKLIIGPLGGAGTPAQVVGISALLWYVWVRLQRPTPLDGGRQPVRAAFGLFAVAIVLSYVAAMIRPINEGEISTADLGLVSLAGWAGIVLVTSDGVPTLERLFVLLRRVAAMGGALATIGLAQFVTGRQLVELIVLPGLTANQAFAGVADRNGFTRPAGTAIHPIEFGVVLTVILPIAITCAMSMTDRGWFRRWYPTMAIAIAIPLSISRTALVGSAVCLLILVPTWSKTARRLTLVAIAALSALLFVALPGFLGTITGLFTGIASDSSATSRTGSYAIAWEFIERSPLVGRGFSTFLPSYWILDNQYLGLTIETGIVGLAALLLLIYCGIRSAARARKLATDPVSQAMGQALIAAIASGATSTALYDLLGFPMSAGILMLSLGLSGALWRLVRADHPSYPRPI